MFEPIENVKVANSITEAFKSWTSNTGSREYSLITGRAITKFGCGVQKCDVRTVSLGFTYLHPLI